QLDPVNLPRQVGYPYYTARQYDQAEKIFRRYSDHEGLAWVYTATGRYSQAITELEQYRDAMPTEEEEFLASLGQVYALQGKKQEAEKLLADLMQRSKTRYVSPYLIAYIFAGLGDREHALAALDQAYREHDHYMMYLKVDPKFDQLHSEPRFQTLLRGM